MRRRIGMTVALLILLVLALNCVASAEPLTFWSWRGEEALWKRVEQALRDQGEDITINFKIVRAVDYDSILMTSIQGGMGPDIITIRSGGWLVDYAKSKAFVPLEKEIDFSIFPENATNMTSYGDHVYGVPFAMQTFLVYYNRAVFREYGLEEPKTWGELLSVCQVLKDGGLEPIGVAGREGWAMSSVQTAIDASILGDQWINRLLEGKNRFSDPEYIHSLERIVELSQYFQKNFMAANYSDVQSAFAMEMLPMAFFGSWDLVHLQQLNPELEIGVMLVPPEDPNVRPYAYTFSDGGYGINAASKNKEQALKVLKFAATEEFGEMFAAIQSEITPVKGVRVPADKPVLAELTRLVSEHSLSAIHGARSPLTYGKPDSHTTLGNGIQAILAGQSTPSEIGKKLDDAVSSWYEPMK